MPTRRIDMPMECREAAFAPTSADDEARTIDVVWTTGARVLRRRFFSNDFEEELVLSGNAVRMDRLNAGAPVLDTHNRFELGDTIGVVERAWIEGGKGHARLRFSDRDDVEPVWRDIKNGIIRNVSVGYAIHRREITEKDDGPDLHRIIDWEPFEISMVPVPADAGAQTRSENERVFSCEIVNRADAQQKEPNMPKETKAPGGQPEPNDEATRTNPETPAPAPEPAPAPKADPVDADKIRAEAVEEERARVADIQEAVRAFGFEDDVADEFVRSNDTIHEVREKLQKRFAEDKANELPSSGHVRVEAGGQNDRETHVRLMSNALAHRASPGVVTLEDGAEQYRGLTLIDMARECLEREGVKTRGLSRMEIAGLALEPGGNVQAVRAGLHSTSDFPIVLGNEVNRTLRAAYDTAPSTYQPIARRVNASDFRPLIRVQIGDNPRLLKVNEAGEFKEGTIGEGGEQFKLDTFGRIVSVTRQTLINDDLDAFGRLPRSWGVAARALENEIVWGLVTGNGALSDGTALFHADHGNLAGSGGAIGVATVGAGRVAMRAQTSLPPGGKKTEAGYKLRITPSYLVVPSALETAALQFISSIVVPTSDGDVNPYKTTMQPIIEPLLDDDSAASWYMMADPNASGVDTFEYAYLDGQDGIYTEQQMGFDVDGIRFKARHDFGAGAIDYRGVYKNPGP